eukprot:TRINITY_DN478_c0_g1_i1.p1 TRINITY_DN478_c0_g1~~TRINITY_DN478_c0_g1_i1.p1  ORF type:complete len:608 (-),score=164.29 TRINITY_DN478_c0_g1_i1:100-1923(-)
MFWRFGFHAPSAIDTILEREDFTIEDLLDEEDFLQECKQLNKQLIVHLSQPTTLEKLITHLVREPTREELESSDAEFKRNMKYSFMSCEVFCCEIAQMFTALFSNTNLLDLFFSMLDKEEPLHPLSANYFNRMFLTLLQKKPMEVLDYFESKPEILQRMIQHLSSTHIKEALLALPAADESTEGKASQFLLRANVVKLLVEAFKNSQDQEVHANVAECLVELINLASGFTTADITVQLQSEETVSAILTNTYAETPTQRLGEGIIVIVELLHRHSEIKTDPSPESEPLPGLLKAIRPHLPRLVSVLSKNPEVKPWHRTPPFGFARTRLMGFFIALFRTKYDAIDKDLVKLKLLSTALDVFFAYPEHNFLHSAVEEMIKCVIERENIELLMSLFVTAQLTRRISAAFKENDEHLKTPKGMRRGYMGHLVQISTKLKQVLDGSKALREALTADSLASEWASFLEGPYAEQIRLQSTQIGGNKPGGDGDDSGDDDDDDDDLFHFDDVKNDSDELVQAFSRYLTEKVSNIDFSENADGDSDDDSPERKDGESTTTTTTQTSAAAPLSPSKSGDASNAAAAADPEVVVRADAVVGAAAAAKPAFLDGQKKQQ